MKGRLILMLAIIFLVASCQPGPFTPDKKNMQPVRDSVLIMMQHLSTDLERMGPAAWINYFDPGPDFYMASDGKLAFKNFPGARLFIEDSLVHAVRKINLVFSQMRIDSLGPQLAAVGAVFHEDITDPSINTFSVNGYFTALLTQTGQGWKIRNLHWSMDKTK
jgi:hypothetical protein